MNSPITTFIVLHRTLGSADESASEIEQKDKILYYYPESTPISIQLNRCNMIEGIIDFFTKFSYDDDCIESVLMERQLWSFVRCDCDNNLWIVAAMNTDSTYTGSKEYSVEDSTNSNPSKYQAYTDGLRDSIKKLYRIYSIFHPTISQVLTRKHFESTEVRSGWELIRHVQSLRKKSRKLFQSLQQYYADIETIRLRNERLEYLEQQKEDDTADAGDKDSDISLSSNRKSYLSSRESKTGSEKG